MKRWALVGLVLFFAACGGVRRVAIDFHLPEPAATESAEGADDAYLAGWEQLGRGEAESALKSFVQSASAADLTLTGQGYALLALKRWPEARRRFEQALQANPHAPLPAVGLATLLELQNDRDRAFQAFGRLLAEHPDQAWARQRYEAIQQSATREWLQKAEACRQRSDPAGQIAALQQAAYFSPELEAVQRQIADYRYLNGELEASLPYYEKLLDQKPGDTDLLLRLTEIYEKLNRLDSALLAVNRLIAARPGDETLPKRREAIRAKFQLQDLPQKFKNIFLKAAVTREDLAALIGYYFGRYIPVDSTPIILTDIAGSYAREEIVRVATAGIMTIRPDHSFDRWGAPDRADFAVTLSRLLDHLEKRMGKSLHLPLAESPLQPADLTELHRNYAAIAFLVNAGILPLDGQNNFNSTAPVSADEAVFALKRILNGLSD